jgi:hypothetical protein
VACCRVGQLLESLGLPLLLGDVPQAFLESGHFAEPLHLVGFFESFLGVGLDLEEPRHLGGIHAEHRTAEAPLTELAAAYRLVGGRLRGGAASLSA